MNFRGLDLVIKVRLGWVNRDIVHVKVLYETNDSFAEGWQFIDDPADKKERTEEKKEKYSFQYQVDVGFVDDDDDDDVNFDI